MGCRKDWAAGVAAVADSGQIMRINADVRLTDAANNLAVLSDLIDTGFSD